MNAFWIILAGSLAATTCALLGCFLILRRMAMIGDAISHAVLPGIVAAFILTGSRDALPMLAGAGLLGVFSTFLIEFFHRKARLQADAAIGVTFTWLFALGIILISVYAGKIDLDQDCVLYGEIAYTPIDVWITDAGRNMGPRAVWILSSVLLLVAALIAAFFRPLFLTSFDPGYAASIGVATGLWHYILMGAVSLSTVAAFESVGAILVVALLVAPPATAFLLTDKFKIMLLLAVFLGIAASVAGYFLAAFVNGSIAGAIATITGLQFLLALLFSPSHGILYSKRHKTGAAPAKASG